MEHFKIVKRTWLSQKPNPASFVITAFLVFLLSLATIFYLDGSFRADEWMPASAEAVLKNHQSWRLWTSLFAHGDLGHLLSNLLLFIPFSYFLSGYFGVLFFPLLGFAMGGLTNLLVLRQMPEQTLLIGASGVVYWMGAAWLTLFLLIERRESFRRRIGKVAIITVALFIPEAYKPEVSYLSHFIGFLLGVGAGFALYLIRGSTFRAAEVVEEEIPEEFPSESIVG